MATPMLWIVFYLLNVCFAGVVQHDAVGHDVFPRYNAMKNYTDGLIENSISTEIKQLVKELGHVANMNTCHRNNTLRAVDSCIALKASGNGETTSPGDMDRMLDNAKDIYAIGASLCEIASTEEPLPSACMPLLPGSLPLKHQKWGFFFRSSTDSKMPQAFVIDDYTDPATLTACRKALWEFADGKGWTSFSNARYKAATLCDLVRADVEKQEALKLFEVLKGETHDVVTDLHESQQLRDKLKADFHSSRDALNRFVNKISRDLNEQITAFKHHWDSIYSHMQRDVLEAAKSMAHIRSKAGDTLEDIERAQKGMAQVMDKYKQQTETAALQNIENSKALTLQTNQGMHQLAAELRAFAETYNGLMTDVYEYSMQVQVLQQDVATTTIDMGMLRDQAAAMLDDIALARQEISDLLPAMSREITKYLRESIFAFAFKAMQGTAQLLAFAMTSVAFSLVFWFAILGSEVPLVTVLSLVTGWVVTILTHIHFDTGDLLTMAVFVALHVVVCLIPRALSGALAAASWAWASMHRSKQIQMQTFDGMFMSAGSKA